MISRFDTIMKKRGSVNLHEAKKDRILTQYIKSGYSNKPAPANISLASELVPGLYTPQYLPEGGITFVKQTLSTDDLLLFEGSQFAEIIEEVNKFWKLKKDFDKLGFIHKRGILLHGAPGSGKTGLIHLLVEEMIKKKDIIFQAEGVGSLISGLTLFREVEPDRKLLVILEDIDALISYGDSSLTKLLDGQSQIDNVLYIATTNYLERLPDRIKNRPSRFDKVLEIKMPNVEGRLTYLTKKLSKFEKEGVIAELAEATEGFSFAHLREFVIAVYALKNDANKTINRLRGMTPASIGRVAEAKVSQMLEESFNMGRINRSNKLFLSLSETVN